MKKIGLMGLVASALLLTACGGGSKNSDPMNDKKYITIFTEVQSGICESNDFKIYLTSIGVEDFLARETANDTSCETYGKQNDGNECAMRYAGGGNSNCVIGFNTLNGQGNLRIFSLDMTETFENSF